MDTNKLLYQSMKNARGQLTYKSTSTANLTAFQVAPRSHSLLFRAAKEVDIILRPAVTIRQGLVLPSASLKTQKEKGKRNGGVCRDRRSLLLKIG